MGFSLFEVFLIWILAFGFISFHFKEKISSFILKNSTFPTFINYFLLILPLILFEEFLTCETPYFTCLQTTLVAFYLFYIIIYFIQKKFKLSYLKTSLLFGLIGWINEFIFVGRIYTLDLLSLILLSILGFLIYFILAIIPSHYLEKTFSKDF